MKLYIIEYVFKFNGSPYDFEKKHKVVIAENEETAILSMFPDYPFSDIVYFKEEIDRTIYHHENVFIACHEINEVGDYKISVMAI